MVDGSFDPLHEGHIEYFKSAAELGLPILCNIASDSWTRQKHPVLLEQSRRAIVLDSIRYISFVLVGCDSTLIALEAVKPKVFAKGRDWLDRGGLPSEELDICARLEIDVKFFDSVRNSSSAILGEFNSQRDRQ
jgi:cytidyltransferase-like protein